MKKITVKDLAKCCCMNCHNNWGLTYSRYGEKYQILNNERVLVSCDRFLYFKTIRKTCQFYSSFDETISRVPHEIYRELKR